MMMDSKVMIVAETCSHFSAVRNSIQLKCCG